MKKLVFTSLLMFAIGSFAIAQPNPLSFPAEDFTIGPGTQGSTVSLLNTVNVEKKVVVLDFMATWCGPCAVSTPAMSATNTLYGDDIEVWAIDIQDDQSISQINSSITNWGANYEGFEDGCAIYQFYMGYNPAAVCPSDGSRPLAYSIPFFAVIGYDLEIFMSGVLGCANPSPNGGCGSSASDVHVRTAIDAALLKMPPDDPPPTGINEQVSPIFISLYPNPAVTSSDMVLRVKNTAEVNVEIYNVLGEKVATPFAKTVKGGVEEIININTSSFVQGIYLVKVRSGDSTKTVKLNVFK